MEEQHLQRFLIGSVCAARIRVYAYIDHVSNHTEKHSLFQAVLFMIQKAYTSIMMGRIIGLLFVSLYMNFPT